MFSGIENFDTQDGPTLVEIHGMLASGATAELKYRAVGGAELPRFPPSRQGAFGFALPEGAHAAAPPPSLADTWEGSDGAFERLLRAAGKVFGAEAAAPPPPPQALPPLPLSRGLRALLRPGRS
mmetsp:Transcript_2662/g.8590  ORF Transcript_2662/g.8590 Transcript_2662/m.8590 type:complete len:124 (-) Transcript_2662:104-475(-)